MQKKWYVPLLFVIPALTGLLIFRIGPIFFSMIIGFTDWSPFGEAQFVGLENFQYLFESESEFYDILKNTLIYSGVFVPGVMLLALVLALAVNQKIRGVEFFRVLFFTPVITSTVAIGIVWSWIFGTDLGAINYILRSVLNISDPPAWLRESESALFVVAAVYIFKRVGYYMIIYLAGLQDIPRSLIEASAIDGAKRWQIFRDVTLPLLTPTTFFILIVATIDSFKSLEIIYTMTKGGPGVSTTTLSYYIYQNAFQIFQMGYAGSVAMILLLIVGVIIGTMMVPVEVIIIPEFILMDKLGWVGTYLPMIVPAFLIGSTGTFLLRSFFENVPRELEEAAMIDGAGSFRIYFQIFLPLAKAPLAALFIISFLINWNDLLRPLVYLNEQDKFTLPLGLISFVGEYTAKWNFLLAGAVVSIVPLLIVYFFLQKQFIEGVTGVGIKG